MFLLLILMSVVFGLHAHTCPNGYHHHQDSCYALVPIKSTWAQAQSYCSAIGGHLAVVDSEAKRNYLHQYIETIHSVHNTYYWIGGFNFIDGSWMWAPSLKSMENIVWNGPNEPSGRLDEHCIIMVPNDQYKFSDFECNTKQEFVCEAIPV